MNKKHKKKCFTLVAILILLGIALGLILYALKQNINLFYTPTQLLQKPMASSQSLRLGGYVKKNSIHYDATGSAVNFILTDNKNEIAVSFAGILPNLFKEGQGVVVTGMMQDAHHLFASQVLAKHDEKYMPLKS